MHSVEVVQSITIDMILKEFTAIVWCVSLLNRDLEKGPTSKAAPASGQIWGTLSLKKGLENGSLFGGW